MDGVGAWHPDGLQDFLERDAAVVAAGNGARVAPELVREPAVAGRTDRVPDQALRISHHEMKCMRVRSSN
jgi:hypothetical protein